MPAKIKRKVLRAHQEPEFESEASICAIKIFMNFFGDEKGQVLRKERNCLDLMVYNKAIQDLNERNITT